MKQKICKDLNFADCELAILRMAVDKAQDKIAKRVVNSEEITKIIQIVEDFIKMKNLICYGGTAINNILPNEDQFYNKEAEIPDYDFFSTNALQDAKELADIYFASGFTDVEAKSGQHHGTYKVFVNFIPVADITHLERGIYSALKKDSIRVSGILYASPNFLRMSMYLELSRPAGDTSRWEKVLKRLSLLNKNYPLSAVNCDHMEYQRDMENSENKEKEDEIYENVKDTFINQGVVFFGGYAISLYSQYLPAKQRLKFDKIADFDVISNNPDTTAEIVKDRLRDIGITNTKVIKRNPIGEIVPEHVEIKIGNDTIAFIYKTIACHSYNVVMINGKKVRVATIDTMLSFYLAFLYADKPYYNDFLERILCMAKLLFDVQQKNRLEQKGLLRRFSIICYGHQDSIEELRAQKAKEYKDLKQLGDRAKFEESFLNYKPDGKKQELKTKDIKQELKTKDIKKHKKINKSKSKSKKHNLTNIYSKKPKFKQFKPEKSKTRKNKWFY